MTTTANPIEHSGGSVWLILPEVDGTLMYSTTPFQEGCVMSLWLFRKPSVASVRTSRFLVKPGISLY